MDIVSRIDPELSGARAFLIGALGFEFMSSGSAADRRATLQNFLDQVKPKELPFPEVKRTEQIARNEKDGVDVRVLVYTPPKVQSPSPAILYIHGGGFSVGSVEEDDGNAAMLAATLGCIVASVDYRLSPETVHPGPIEDCYAALLWLGENTGKLGIDPKRIAVYGQSAGGGLSALVTQVSRDRGGPAICYQMLIYPMLDDRLTGASYQTRNGIGLFDKASVAYGWEQLLDNGRLANLSYASTARVTDYAGLPPAYVDVGELDVLLDENIDYAHSLLKAGIPVELHIYANTFHGFDLFVADAGVSHQARANRITALRRALNLPAQN